MNLGGAKLQFCSLFLIFANLLNENGYDGQVVMMNGSNADLIAVRFIMNGWNATKEPTQFLVHARDMKAAIVEAFKSDDKSILIATESRAEGINLQFW